MVSLSDIEQDWWFHVCDFAVLNTTSRAGFNTRQVYLQWSCDLFQFIEQLTCTVVYEKEFLP